MATRKRNITTARTRTTTARTARKPATSAPESRTTPGAVAAEHDLALDAIHAITEQRLAEAQRQYDKVRRLFDEVQRFHRRLEARRDTIAQVDAAVRQLARTSETDATLLRRIAAGELEVVEIARGRLVYRPTGLDRRQVVETCA